MNFGKYYGVHEAADDSPADNTILHEDSIDEFRRVVTALHRDYGELPHEEFLRRTGIYSGKYLTSAGALMFGECLDIRAVLTHRNISAEIGATNIWEAYTNILPRLTCRLSYDSAQNFRAAFIRALLNSDYSLSRKILITITSGPPRAIIDNPGVLGRSRKNHRLTKIFTLAGMLPCRKYFTPPEQTDKARITTTIPLNTTPNPILL